jgi:hypothetical protein
MALSQELATSRWLCGHLRYAGKRRGRWQAITSSYPRWGQRSGRGVPGGSQHANRGRPRQFSHSRLEFHISENFISGRRNAPIPYQVLTCKKEQRK